MNRAALPEEYPQIREIIATAFKGDEADLWDYLIAHDTSLEPQNIRVRVVGDEVVACAVYLPRQIRVRGGWVRGGVVTVVACAPKAQGMGHGTQVMADCLERVAADGGGLAILYGHPTFYPRVGFVPVMINEKARFRVPSPKKTLEPVMERDLPALFRLFQSREQPPCAVDRPAIPWIWQVRGEGAQLMKLGEIGYALVTKGEKSLSVYEVAVEAEGAEEMLLGLGHLAEEMGLEQVQISRPPQSLLSWIRLWGGEESRGLFPPGMAWIADWSAILPPGYAYCDGALTYQGELVIKAPKDSLAQLALGTFGVSELRHNPGVQIVQEERLTRDFPPLSPYWSPAPYWY